MANLGDVPSEVLHNIAGNLTYSIDLCSLSQTNRRLYTIASEHLNRHLRQVFHSPLRSFESNVLHKAAERGNEASVRRLLQAGVPPAPPLVNPWHPIILAAQNGHANVVQVFLQYGVDPNPTRGFHEGDSFGNPLTVAVENGHEAVVKVLIDHGVDLEFTRQNLYFRQPLSLAAQKPHPRLVKLLLEHGCNPLTPDFYPDHGNETNAWIFAAGADLGILQMFIDRGIEPEFSGFRNHYPVVLKRALEENNLPLVKFLLEHGIEVEMAETHLRDRTCSDPFRPVDFWNIFFLFAQAAGKNPEDAAFLLRKVNVDDIIERKDLRKIVCLMVGATYGGCGDLVQRLLEDEWASKYPNVQVDEWKDHLGAWLLIAVTCGHIGLVELFLDHGADPSGVVKNKQTRSGYYPPIFAAAEKGLPEILKLLLDRGANPFPRQQRFTLFQKAVSSPLVAEACMEITRLLVERDILAPKNSDNRDIIVHAVSGGAGVFQLVLQHLGVELRIGDPYHEEAFATAVQAGDTVIMEMFLKAGFNPNSKSNLDPYGTKSFLALAAKAGGGLPGIAERAVDLLLKYGADIRWRHPQTNSPLLYMIEDWGKHPEAVRLLLKKGADLLSVVGRGKTFLVGTAEYAWARPKGALAIAKVLLEFFDEMPFSQAKCIVVEAATVTRSEELAGVLWRWYWRRVYPCPNS